MAGDPRFEASQSIPDFPYASYAESIGLRGFTMEKPKDVVRVWEQALRSDRPVVVEARVDPDVPPLPPHITVQEAKAFAASVIRGDPDAGHIIRQTLRDWLGGKRKRS